MKRAGYETRILEVNGITIGVILTGDYTAEHEGGIRTILARLSIDPDGMFVKGRSMTMPLQEYKTKLATRTSTYYPAGKPRKKVTEKVLVLSHQHDTNPPKHHIDLAQRFDMESDITGAWDRDNFIVCGWTERGHEAVRLIADGIKTGDITAWIGGAGDNPFARGGLALARTSLIPAEQQETMRTSDQLTLDTNAAAEATGIERRIQEANGGPGMSYTKPHGYAALSPRMISEEEQQKLKTDYPVKFWLNPCSRQANSGYYTVEELEEWLEGKGPVLKKKEAA